LIRELRELRKNSTLIREVLSQESTTGMGELLFKDEVFAIVGAAMEVHTILGCGFLEPVYQEAMELELTDRKIPYVAQQELTISYKAHRIRKTYIVDLMVYGKIIVELKALDHLTGREEAQLINYLKASDQQVGVLINFGEESLKWKRMVYDHARH
jgi:GxxExxY protein